MPKLIAIKGPAKGQIFAFNGDTVFIGRSSKNDIQIRDTTISRKQVKIFRIGGKFFVEDLKSTNGTSINGTRIDPGEGFEVGERDTISMGDSMIRLSEMPTGKTLDPDNVVTQHLAVDSLEKDRLAKDRRIRSPKSLELMYKVSQLFRQPREITETLNTFLEYLFETFPRVDRAAIILFDKQKKHVKEIVGKSRREQLNESTHYNPEVVDRVMREGKAVRMSNTAYEPEAALLGEQKTLNIKSILCVPMMLKAEICGALYVDSLKVPYGFRKEDLLLLNSLSGPVAFAIENAQLSSRIKELEHA